MYVYYAYMENKFFHDQFPNETFYGFFSQHWFFLLSPVSRYLLVIITIGIGTILSVKFLPAISVEMFRLVGIILFLIILIETQVFFCAIVSWLLTIVILTDIRVIEVIKSLFLHDEKEVVDLKKVQDIQMRKIGLIRNFLDMGRIYLTLANIKDSKAITHVPHVSYWTQKFNKVRLKSISRKKGLDDAIDSISHETERHISEIPNLDV